VWSSPWNYTKILFFLTRYLPIINIPFFLEVELMPDVGPDLCRVMLQTTSWILTAEFVFSEAVLLIRTWAVWRRDQRIGILLFALISCCTVLGFVSTVQFLHSQKFEPPPYRGYRGCFYTQVSTSLLKIMIGLAVVDGVFLTLMMMSAFRAYKSGDHGELTNVIHRDAIVFYVYLLVCSTASAIIAYCWPVSFSCSLVAR